MNRSDQINELAAALAKAQAAIKDAELDRTNPHFGNPYSTLSAVWAACRAPLTSNGLAVSQIVEVQDGKLGVKTMLMHASGQFMCSFCPATAQQNGMQALGSAITYAKRYSLAAMVGVASGEEKEDDDGNKADKNPPRQRSAPKPKAEAKDPPAKAAPKAQDETTEPAEFVMHLGSLAGTKVSECDLGDLKKAQEFLESQPKEKLGEKDKAALAAIRLYFANLERQQ